MSRLDETTILTEDFEDDDCTDDRTGADWFKPRVISIAEFLEHRAEPTREFATVVRMAALGSPSLVNTDRDVQAKGRELLVSAILFSVICLASIVVILFGGNLLFWTPIALGSFGVGGSSALYLRQLRTLDSEETEPLRSYG